VLWFVCGGTIFAVAYLFSTVSRGPYTAPALAIAVLFLQSAIPEWPPLEGLRLNIFWTMGEFGTMHWDAARQELLPGPMPWTRLAVLSAVAALFLGLSVRIANRQDF
jgi:hypothetical protein